MTAEEAIDELKLIFPPLKVKWEEHLKLWEGEERSFEDDMSFISQTLVHEISNSRYVHLKKVFNFIEKMLKATDEKVKAGALNGGIRVLKVKHHYRTPDFDIVQYLGELSLKEWQNFDIKRLEAV